MDTVVQILDLRGLGISQIPEECLEMDGIEDLRLTENNLKSLPDEVRTIAASKYLACLECSDSFPKCHLSRPRRQHVSRCICATSTAKQTLVAFRLQVEKWKDSMEKLTMNNNKLLRFPEVVRQWSHLREIQLTGNEIMDIPSWIGELKDLTSLKIADNKIRRLPLALAQMPRLEEIDATGNPITSPPPEVVARGAVAIREYLQKFIYAQKTRILNFNELGIAEVPSEIWCAQLLTFQLLPACADATCPLSDWVFHC